jgi:integrase/recombinase XerD
MATTPRRHGAVADRAKLDKENFWLHKFRATFATRCLWAGVDLRTVQLWIGHSDMDHDALFEALAQSADAR